MVHLSTKILNDYTPRLTKLGAHFAQRRTNHIKHVLFKKSKPDYLGKIYMMIGEPLVYLAGKVLNIIKGKK